MVQDAKGGGGGRGGTRHTGRRRRRCAQLRATRARPRGRARQAGVWSACPCVCVWCAAWGFVCRQIHSNRTLIFFSGKAGAHTRAHHNPHAHHKKGKAQQPEEEGEARDGWQGGTTQDTCTKRDKKKRERAVPSCCCLVGMRGMRTRGGGRGTGKSWLRSFCKAWWIAPRAHPGGQGAQGGARRKGCPKTRSKPNNRVPKGDRGGLALRNTNPIPFFHFNEKNEQSLGPLLPSVIQKHYSNERGGRPVHTPKRCARLLKASSTAAAASSTLSLCPPLLPTRMSSNRHARAPIMMASSPSLPPAHSSCTPKSPQVPHAHARQSSIPS